MCQPRVQSAQRFGVACQAERGQSSLKSQGGRSRHPLCGLSMQPDAVTRSHSRPGAFPKSVGCSRALGTQGPLNTKALKAATLFAPRRLRRPVSSLPERPEGRRIRERASEILRSSVWTERRACVASTGICGSKHTRRSCCSTRRRWDCRSSPDRRHTAHDAQRGVDEHHQA